MTARNLGFAGIAVYLIVMFAVLLLVARAFGIWWEIGLIPVEMVGGIVLGFFTAKAHTHWDQSPPPYALQAAKDIYGRKS